ncbi:ABC-1 domain-containing protein [Nitrososphaera viennensis EN76]|uniref:ABC-1 domain-containing protein n=1 Tax=Nitrososphaera viennensis EN76 TaxID=926571 RepID=A0A060HKN0_9ARCH|nr:ABC-1 domain-containing protein [Nitrososphaera viennensis EN76]
MNRDLEDPSQLKEQIAFKYISSSESPAEFKRPSRLHVARIILKLLPVALNFRRDRREWVKHEGRNVDEEKYRKHARRALKTFLELGPSYIKLGQWLSTRADMLPLPYMEELSKLQDDVPPAPFEQVKGMIETELGGKIEEAFESFNTVALSGASLGQVYLARHDGKDVIVKVARPGIEESIEKDIYILRKILPLATKFIDPNLRFSAEGMLAQFAETVHEEMDYRIEAENLVTIRQNLADDSTVLIPRVYPERTSRHVLTMDYLPGTKITDIEELDRMRMDREKLVVRVHRLFFKMLLRHNIFHADPHPGNISVSGDGKIILYDFGMVGRLDNATRLKLIRLYLGLVEKDAGRTVNVLMELGTLEPNANRYVIEKAIDLSIQSLYGRQVDKMEVKALMDLANKTMSRFPFKLPKNLALYMRMTSILEGIYQHHRVRFQFIKVLANLLEEEGLIREAYIEEAKSSVQRIRKSVEAAMNLGQFLQSAYDSVLSGKTGNNNNNNNLMAGSILAASLFIGSSIIYPQNSLAAYAGFGAAAVTIAVSIFKRKS